MRFSEDLKSYGFDCMGVGSPLPWMPLIVFITQKKKKKKKKKTGFFGCLFLVNLDTCLLSN
jgi:hypothetical protein